MTFTKNKPKTETVIFNHNSVVSTFDLFHIKRNAWIAIQQVKQRRALTNYEKRRESELTKDKRFQAQLANYEGK